MPRMMVAGRAVGDLIHLLAELLDNATSFSPPDARIDVRGNRVGKGVVLEIEDQGLGIEPERMEQLNVMLRSDSSIGPSAKSQDWRLGLFVVSRLARRHGINVTLVESAYGGVRAIALVPMTLLTDVPENEADDDGAGDLALAGTAPTPNGNGGGSNGNGSVGNGHRPRPRPRHARNGSGADATVVAEPTGTAPAPLQSVPSPDEIPAADVPVADVPVADVPVADVPAAAGPAQAKPGSRPGLPTRRRQSHVVAELKDAPPEDVFATADDAPDDTTAIETFTVADDAAAQQARSRMSAFQRGTAGGRSTN
jgi:hypothetical protein